MYSFIGGLFKELFNAYRVLESYTAKEKVWMDRRHSTFGLVFALSGSGYGTATVLSSNLTII